MPASRAHRAVGAGGHAAFRALAQDPTEDDLLVEVARAGGESALLGWHLQRRRLDALGALDRAVHVHGEEIARLGPGDVLGEAAIVNNKLRNASVVALTKLEMLHFTAEKVRSLSEDIPAFRDALQKLASEHTGRRAD